VLLNNELKEQKQYHITYQKEMLMKLDDATTRIHDLEKKNEDIILQLSNYENEIHTVRTELQASQKEVRKLTDDLNKKVRYLTRWAVQSIENVAELCLESRQNIILPESKRLDRIHKV
jgi:peptidoglycan hydrolase CwlO-like protein